MRSGFPILYPFNTAIPEIHIGQLIQRAVIAGLVDPDFLRAGVGFRRIAEGPAYMLPSHAPDHLLPNQITTQIGGVDKPAGAGLFLGF
jgi:hypothetical protein